MTQSNRYCSNCGAALAPDLRFCGNCGQPVPFQPAPNPAGPAAPSSSRKWLLIAGVGAGLLALCACVAVIGFAVSLYPVYFKRDQQNQETALATQTRVASATDADSAQAASVTPETALPTPLPPTPLVRETPLPENTTVDLSTFDSQGVSFSYDPTLASTVAFETLAAQTGGDIPPWELAPERRRMSFEGYPAVDAHHVPQIVIYPVQEYHTVDPGIGDRFATLQQLLQMKPATNLPEPLPFFPSWNAGQVMAAQVEYLDFKNGSGVRYLTQYAQDVYPINNQSLFYTFQGITRDRQWLIAAVMPVSNDILPDPEPVAQDPGFYDNYAAYLENIKQLLNEQPDSSYQPDLSVLDALFQSLEVK